MSHQHEWTSDPTCYPIPAIAFSPGYWKLGNRYNYICKTCGWKYQSKVRIFAKVPKIKEQCEHDFVPDPMLGPKYNAYRCCTKCGKQQISLTEPILFQAPQIRILDPTGASPPRDICTEHDWRWKPDTSGPKTVHCVGYIGAPPRRDEKYNYICKKCNHTMTSFIKIPCKEYKGKKCQHDFFSDPALGEKFKEYKKCKKCGKQQGPKKE